MAHIDSDSSNEIVEEAALIVCMGTFLTCHFNRRPHNTSDLSGSTYVQELLTGHPGRIYDMLRMDKHVFDRLCNTLQTRNLLHHDRHVSIQESVAMFLYILSHSERVRVTAERFQRSNDTIHRQFKRVLNAVCRLGDDLIRPQTQGSTPPEILNNPKYYPYFEKCIGAIDGTHVAAVVPRARSMAYRGRKSIVTQNVMCACSFDMMFTFVYAGWEGTANDARIFMHALTRPNTTFPFPEEGINSFTTKMVLNFMYMVAK